MNNEWVAGAIAKRQRVYLASNPEGTNLFDGGPHNGGYTVFGVEYYQFLDAGYSVDGHYMNPPAN
jgi:hypothetical protein